MDLAELQVEEQVDLVELQVEGQALSSREDQVDLVEAPGGGAGGGAGSNTQQQQMVGVLELLTRRLLDND